MIFHILAWLLFLLIPVIDIMDTKTSKFNRCANKVEKSPISETFFMAKQKQCILCGKQQTVFEQRKLIFWSLLEFPKKTDEMKNDLFVIRFQTRQGKKRNPKNVNFMRQS